MKFRTLIRRNLAFHWRAHVGVVLGAAIGSAALIGALVVGDSVKGSLQERAVRRLSGVHLALSPRDRLFEAALFQRILDEGTTNAARLQGNPRAEPSVVWGSVNAWNGSVGLLLPANAIRQDGAARANAVSCYGMDDRFFKFLAGINEVPPGSVYLNEALAGQLNARVGDRLIVRVQKPSALSTESSIAQRSASSVALSLTVAGILPPWPGEFSLESKATPALNAFLSLAELQRGIAREGRANLMLISWGLEVRRATLGDRFGFFIRELLSGGAPLSTAILSRGGMADDRAMLPLLQTYLDTHWRLQDAEAALRLVAAPPAVEIRSERVFLDPPVARAALGVRTNAQPLLTYLATLLRAGTNATPYSMVTAAGAPWTPPDMRDDEIVVSQWLADDLQVKPGDEIAMSYFLPESGAKLAEATNTFRVRRIVPAALPWADRTLMPDFPGIEKAESTRDWDAGFPLTYEVRKKDDDYWKQQRGTPKAFITLAAGQKLWGNRFGNLTAIRFPILTNLNGATPALTPARSPGERENRPPSPNQPDTEASTALPEQSTNGQSLFPLPGGEGQGEGESQTLWTEEFRAALEKAILANLRPEELGLRFEPVREQALQAAAGAQDFGGLFLGFSFFLIAAALLLMAMLFQFGLEQRAPEIGTLLALGFTPRQVRKLLVREGVALAFLGGVLGAVGGIYFARAMLHGLTTVWRDAVGATALQFHVTGATLITGLLASVVVSVITLWLALRKFIRRAPRELLAGDTAEAPSKVRNLRTRIITLAALLAGVGLAGWTMATGNTADAEAFFGAGSLILIAGLGFVSLKLSRIPSVRLSSAPAAPAGGKARVGSFNLTSLALQGCARRRKRSLGTVAMLACGSFLIVSIGVFRLDANRDATRKSAGTGGFALVGATTLPVVHDLNARSGRDFFALNDQDLQGVDVVPFRVREGDEASCLNLNAAQRPRLLGVKPEALVGRFGFAKGNGWEMLGSSRREESPAQDSGERSLLTSAATNEIEIPAIGDANSIQWAMKKQVGDTIDYVDERGQPFRVRIVGAVANSILQGQLIIDEAEFVRRFPSEAGYRLFLIDAPTNRVAAVSATLSRALEDVGLELTPTATRLAQFNAVQNTYLGTFQVLGGLGLLLGSVGLGIVVLRNVLERRGELALLVAVGFRRQQVQRLLLVENSALLAAGLGIGVLAAAVAVLPAVLSPAAQLPVTSLGVTLVAILLNGLLWTWVATRFAVRGDLLRALRNE